jgi:hypothetical protein
MRMRMRWVFTAAAVALLTACGFDVGPRSEITFSVSPGAAAFEPVVTTGPYGLQVTAAIEVPCVPYGLQHAVRFDGQTVDLRVTGVPGAQCLPPGPDDDPALEYIASILIERGSYRLRVTHDIPPAGPATVVYDREVRVGN